MFRIRPARITFAQWALFISSYSSTRVTPLTNGMTVYEFADPFSFRGTRLTATFLRQADGLLHRPNGTVVGAAVDFPFPAADRPRGRPCLFPAGDMRRSRRTWPDLRRLPLRRPDRLHRDPPYPVLSSGSCRDLHPLPAPLQPPP